MFDDADGLIIVGFDLSSPSTAVENLPWEKPTPASSSSSSGKKLALIGYCVSCRAWRVHVRSQVGRVLSPQVGLRVSEHELECIKLHLFKLVVLGLQLLTWTWNDTGPGRRRKQRHQGFRLSIPSSRVIYGCEGYGFYYGVFVGRTTTAGCAIVPIRCRSSVRRLADWRRSVLTCFFVALCLPFGRWIIWRRKDWNLVL